jgi:octaprenyl-diphosphate synthase
MKLSLAEIKAPIIKEMDEFESRFGELMRSSVPLLDRITHYIVRRKGKQMRPMFVFLSAGLCGGITEATYRGAGLIELLHTATLVHDDVVDDSNLRRGFFSINALWKNKIAVLVGDYLLSRGLLLSVKHKDFELLSIVSEAVRQMSEGELLQLEKARRLDIKEQVYYDIIRQKTASLIASCCAVGAASAGSDDETISRMRMFGEKTGMAFQIKDDLFDFGEGSNIGKPSGSDIKESKLTLPLIYALQNTNGSVKRGIINIVKNNRNEPEKISQVLQFVRESGGIGYAKKKMDELCSEAYSLLAGFPESEYRSALEKLVRFTTEREN